MAVPTAEERARVRAYLLQQSTTLSWRELWTRVTPARLGFIEALRGVTDDQSRFRPAADEWSILEVAAHLADNSAAVIACIETLAAGGRVLGGPTVDEYVDPGDTSLGEWRERLIDTAMQLSAVVSRLPDTAPLEATHPHGYFGELHCKAWYLFQRVHDLDHTQQVASIKAAPGYPAS
jgi:hypothetical protein